MRLQRWTQTWEGWCPAALLPKWSQRKWNKVLTDDDPMPNSFIALQRIRLWRSRFRSDAPDRQDVRRVRVTLTIEEIADTERGYTSE
ncbi:MAG: hypothetical protein ABFE07_08350 [Armatimonadia bacterium]|jgi:hypothetical protein